MLDVAQRLINARPDRKGKEPFRLEDLPLDDKPTFQLLGSGETKGVFQLESSGMQQLFKDLHPDSFEDIVAAVESDGAHLRGTVLDHAQQIAQHGHAVVVLGELIGPMGPEGLDPDDVSALSARLTDAAANDPDDEVRRLAGYR